MSECFDTGEPRVMKKPAQVPTHVRLCNSCGSPQLLADLIKAARASYRLARKNETVVFHRCGTDHAISPRHATKLRYNARGIIRCFQHRMAQNCVECGVLKREPPAISRYAYKVRSLDGSRVTAGRCETFLVQVYTDDLTSRDRFGQAHRDSRVTTSAIE